VGETNEHVIAGCSSLSESAYLGRHKQPARLIQTAIKYRILDTDTPPHCRHKSEPVLDWSIRTDKTVDFNSLDIAPIDRHNKTALVIDTAVLLTHNLTRTEVQKITKYETLTWK